MTPNTTKMKRRESDAKWRANIASCYESLRLLTGEEAASKRNKMSKVQVLQETEKLVHQLEDTLSNLLDVHAKKNGHQEDEAKTLDDIKNEFLNSGFPKTVKRKHGRKRLKSAATGPCRALFQDDVLSQDQLLPTEKPCLSKSASCGSGSHKEKPGVLRKSRSYSFSKSLLSRFSYTVAKSSSADPQNCSAIPVIRLVKQSPWGSEDKKSVKSEAPALATDDTAQRDDAYWTPYNVYKLSSDADVGTEFYLDAGTETVDQGWQSSQFDEDMEFSSNDVDAFVIAQSSADEDVPDSARTGSEDVGSSRGCSEDGALGSFVGDSSDNEDRKVPDFDSVNGDTLLEYGDACVLHESTVSTFEILSSIKGTSPSIVTLPYSHRQTLTREVLQDSSAEENGNLPLSPWRSLTFDDDYTVMPFVCEFPAE